MLSQEKHQLLHGLRSQYSQKISPLFDLGREGIVRTNQQLNYAQKFGFTDQDIPELLRLAQDKEIYDFDYDDISEDEDLTFFAVIHAWYALSELKAPEAKDVFVKILVETGIEDGVDDWILGGFVHLIKPYRNDMIDFFVEQIKRTELSSWVKVAYLDVLEEMLKLGEIPESVLHGLFEDIFSSLDQQHEILVSSVVSICKEFVFKQYYESICQCFEMELVDPLFNGDLEDIEIAFGMRETRTHPRRNYLSDSLLNARQNIYNDKTYIREEPKTGRNDPCPCGSGKKYKKCCLNK